VVLQAEMGIEAAMEPLGNALRARRPPRWLRSSGRVGRFRRIRRSDRFEERGLGWAHPIGIESKVWV
jgi:hypothetical protein